MVAGPSRASVTFATQIHAFVFLTNSTFARCSSLNMGFEESTLGGAACRACQFLVFVQPRGPTLSFSYLLRLLALLDAIACN